MSWKFQLDKTDKVIDKVCLKLGHKTYENGVVDVTLSSKKFSVKLPQGSLSCICEKQYVNSVIFRFSRCLRI